MGIKRFITKILTLKNDKLIETELKKENLKRYQQALAVVLVDIALVDNEFDYAEHAFIFNALAEQFNLTKDQLYKLIEEAESLVNESNDIDSYGTILRDLISSEECESVMHTLDQLAKIDNNRSHYESKLRQRYEKLLGVRVIES